VNDLRNPHVGEPFTDDDAAIAAALEDVSAAVLLWDFGDTLVDERWMLRAPASCPGWPSARTEVNRPVAAAAMTRAAEFASARISESTQREKFNVRGISSAISANTST